MKPLRNIFRWLWYAAREYTIDPIWVDFPVEPGPLRFVFTNGPACQVIVWCWDNTVVSCGPTEDNPNEVVMVIDKPAKAMGVVGAAPEALFKVLSGDVELTRGLMSPYAFDLARTQTYYVPRWRVVWKVVRTLFIYEEWLNMRRDRVEAREHAEAIRASQKPEETP